MRVNRLVCYVALSVLLNIQAHANVVVTATRPCAGKADGKYNSDTGSIIACKDGRVDKNNSTFAPEYEVDMFSDNSATGEIVSAATSDNSSPTSGTSTNKPNSSTGSSDSSNASTNSSSSSSSDSGSNSDSSNGVLPPSLPIPQNVPNNPANAALNKAIQDLRERYQKAFEQLKKDEDNAKKVLAESLNSCVLLYGGTDRHDRCAESVRNAFQLRLQEIKKRFDRLKQNMAADFAELMKNAGINSPSIPNPNINGNSNGNGSALGGDVINNQMTHNETNVSNTTNQTINNNTSNVTNISGAGNGNGSVATNVTVNTKDYSGFLGSISGSLNDIKNKLVELASGSSSGSGSGSSSNGSGSATNSGSQQNQESNKGEQECKQSDGSLRCSQVGSADDVSMPDKMDFGIKKQVVDVSKYFNWKRIVGGNENCPAPIKISTSLFTKEIPLQPLCDFAKMIRGVVILLFAMWGMRIALKGES